MSFMIARPLKAKILDLSLCRPSHSRKRLREKGLCGALGNCALHHSTDIDGDAGRQKAAVTPQFKITHRKRQLAVRGLKT
jgi:hypothetical protein